MKLRCPTCDGALSVWSDTMRDRDGFYSIPASGIKCEDCPATWDHEGEAIGD